jgi:hypothetical protein
MGQVVDTKLKVMGAQRLRIADLSVIPTGNRANPNMLAVAIGLKAADLLLQVLLLDVWIDRRKTIHYKQAKKKKKKNQFSNRWTGHQCYSIVTSVSTLKH